MSVCWARSRHHGDYYKGAPDWACVFSGHPLLLAIKDMFQSFVKSETAARSTSSKQPPLSIAGVRAALASDKKMGPVLKSGAHSQLKSQIYRLDDWERRYTLLLARTMVSSALCVIAYFQKGFSSNAKRALP